MTSLEQGCATLGSPKHVLTPFFPQNTFLTELRKFRVKNALTMGTVGTINFKVGKQIDNQGS